MKRQTNAEKLDCEGAGEPRKMEITVYPLAGTSVGNRVAGIGTSEQFTTMLFENENPSLDTATETGPAARTGEMQIARVPAKITADTTAKPEDTVLPNRQKLRLLPKKLMPLMVTTVLPSEFNTSGCKDW